jgi:hypothetical protein
VERSPPLLATPGSAHDAGLPRHLATARRAQAARPGMARGEFYIFTIITNDAHQIVIFRMPLTFLADERSLSSVFTTFAHVASHGSWTRWRPVSRRRSKDIGAPGCFVHKVAPGLHSVRPPSFSPPPHSSSPTSASCWPPAVPALGLVAVVCGFRICPCRTGRSLRAPVGRFGGRNMAGAQSAAMVCHIR